MGKRILIISQRFWPEEGDINTLAAYFAQNGVKTDVLCGQPNYPEGRFYEGYHTFGHKEENYGDIRIYRAMEIQKRGSLQFRPVLNYYSFFFSSSFRINAVKRNQYDAVFVYQTSPVFQGHAGLTLARNRGIRSVIYVRDLWPDSFYKEMDIRDPSLRKIYKAVSRRQYRRASALITPSKEAEKYLIREVAQTPGKVNYVPPFSFEAYGEGTEEIRQRFAGSFNLVYFGNIPRGSFFDMFLEAAGKLISIGLYDVRFIIVGSGEGLSELKKKLNDKGLFDMIYPEGKVSKEKIPSYIRAADVLICADSPESASEYDPPKKIVDYMAMGKPILAAADGEGKEIIRKAKCGFVSDPDDAAAFAQNAAKLYKTPKDELEAMGKRAKDYERENFDPEKCAGKILDILFPDGI